MPRISRETYQFGFFHVMVQEINKLYIFDELEYKKLYFNLIKNNYKKYNISIIAYCIMDNHIHLLIYTKDITELSLFMHKINTIYGMIYNKNKKRCGYVYRNRFKSQYIYDSQYLAKCIKYIHMNPVKSKIVQRECDYIFSSYNEYYSVPEIIDFNIVEETFYEEKIINILNNITNVDVEIMDVDNENDNFEISVKNYLYGHNISLNEIKKDKNELYMFIFEQKSKGYTQRKIAEKLKIDYKKISRILKNEENRRKNEKK